MVGIRHGRFTRLTSHPSRLDRLALWQFGRPDRPLQCRIDEVRALLANGEDSYGAHPGTETLRGWDISAGEASALHRGAASKGLDAMVTVDGRS